VGRGVTDAGSAARARGSFRAGFAVADITPDPGAQRVELSGYVARQQPALGVRDRLQVAALALAVGEEAPLLLVALDLCILDGPTAALLAAACPLSPQRVWLACSHTHAAPATYPLLGCGEPDPGYAALVAKRVGGAARSALATMEPCRLGWGRTALAPPLWGNRRDPAGPWDGRIHLLKIERAESDRAPVVAVWSLACHPVVLGPENRMVSADFVGVVREALSFPSFFLQGCCGDQNPRDRGESALGVWRQAAEALQTLWQGTPTASRGPWAVASAPVALPRLPGDGIPPLPTPDPAVAAAMRLWQGRVATPGAAVPPSRAEVTVLRLGNGRVALWPGEPFVSLQGALPSDTLAVGHVGPSVGYIPDAPAYGAPGYEVGWAHRYYGFPSALAPAAGEALVAATHGLLAAVTDV
jgi:neutral ceramidase